MEDDQFLSEWNVLPKQMKIDSLIELMNVWQECIQQAKRNHLFDANQPLPDFSDILTVIPFLLHNKIYILSGISPDIFSDEKTLAKNISNGSDAYAFVERLIIYSPAIRGTKDANCWFDDFDLALSHNIIFEMLKTMYQRPNPSSPSVKKFHKSIMPPPPVLDREFLNSFLRIQESIGG